MVIPVATDTPTRFRPVATVLIALAQVVIFGMTVGDPSAIKAWSLPLDGHLTQVRWFTASFIHVDLLHLLIDLLFFGGFGLIVEGKLGWKKFLPLCLLLIITGNWLLQLQSDHLAEFSCGNGALIHGLMAICLVWTPLSELIFVGYVTRVSTFNLPITGFSGMALANVWFSQRLFSHSFEQVHLPNLLLGAVIGTFIVKSSEDDSNGWDLWSLLRDGRPCGNTSVPPSTSLLSKRWRKRRRKPRIRIVTHRPETPSVDQFLKLMNAGRFMAAAVELSRYRHFHPEFVPPVEHLLTLARELRKQRDWNESLKFYEEYLTAVPDAVDVRLEATELLVFIQERPKAAERMMSPCHDAELPAELARKLAELSRCNQELIDNGTIELQGEAW